MSWYICKLPKHAANTQGTPRPRGGVFCCILDMIAYTPGNGIHQLKPGGGVYIYIYIYIYIWCPQMSRGEACGAQPTTNGRLQDRFRRTCLTCRLGTSIDTRQPHVL